MRMTADHLFRDALDNIGKCEGMLFFREARVINHLQQKIAELVFQIAEIAALDGVRDFVGFLNRVWRNRRKRLFEVPRAARHRRSERRHDLDQALNVGRWRHGRPLKFARTLAHHANPGEARGAAIYKSRVRPVRSGQSPAASAIRARQQRRKRVRRGPRAQSPNR